MNEKNLSGLLLGLMIFCLSATVFLLGYQAYKANHDQEGSLNKNNKPTIETVQTVQDITSND
jgi:CHASE3 domain sensor protein